MRENRTFREGLKPRGKPEGKVRVRMAGNMAGNEGKAGVSFLFLKNLHHKKFSHSFSENIIATINTPN
jgi:hypothetical protein